MYSILQQRLSYLVDNQQEGLLTEQLLGLERESLRVDEKGYIAQTAHPDKLGSALMHPYITTDYSESLLELITPPVNTVTEALSFLQRVQGFVYQHIQSEVLWAASMPCAIISPDAIQIAYYGKSNAGKMKTVYRRGLAYRYGKMMQVIAGVHVNYSLPESFWQYYQKAEQCNGKLQDFIDDQYFALIRNLQRFGWLIPYLFGMSPAIHQSFLQQKKGNKLQPLDKETLFEEYATSLRMGDIGYQNNKEDKVGVKASYNNLETYVASLNHAIHTSCPEYEKIGVKVDGKYRQLNTHILQIENEYYSTVRPKQIPESNETPISALKTRGVAYIELRSMDVNLFNPLGVSEEQLYFLQSFLLFCLLQESPYYSQQERMEIDKNQATVAHRGTSPRLRLQRLGKTITLKNWGLEIYDTMQGCAEILDKVYQHTRHTKALHSQKEKLQYAESVPAAQLIRLMRENKESFQDISMRYSLEHKQHLMTMPLSHYEQWYFACMAKKSWKQQKEMEVLDNMSFSHYLSRYFA